MGCVGEDDLNDPAFSSQDEVCVEDEGDEGREGTEEVILTYIAR